MLDLGSWKKGSLGFHSLGVFIQKVPQLILRQTAPGGGPSPAFRKPGPREEKQPPEVTQTVPGRTKAQFCQLPSSVFLLSMKQETQVPSVPGLTPLNLQI